MNLNERMPKLISGVYFLYDGTEIVYIGQSANIFARIGAHACNCVAFDSWSFQAIADAGERIKLERAQIQIHKPKFNVLKRKNWHTERMARLAKSFDKPHPPTRLNDIPALETQTGL